MNGNWLKIVQVVGQWLLIFIGLFIGWLNMDRRVTAIESGIEEEQKGYNIAIHGLTRRIDRIVVQMDRQNERLDYLIEKAHEHSP